MLQELVGKKLSTVDYTNTDTINAFYDKNI